MAALDAPIGANADVRKNVAPKSLDDGRAFDNRSGRNDSRQMHRAPWKGCERCLKPVGAVLDLPDPYPHARIDIAFGPHDDLDGCPIVRWIGQADSGVERAPRGPTYVAGGCKLRGEGGGDHARADGTIPK